MVSDSEYSIRGLLLKPWEGAVAGGVGALVMIGWIFLLQQAGVLALPDIFEKIGSLIMFRENALITGVLVHICVGILLGLLYALSQQEAPVSGLFGVAVFYGVVIWVVSGLIIALFRITAVREVVHTWTWLTACVVFGLGLFGLALIFNRTRSGTRKVVLKD